MTDPKLDRLYDRIQRATAHADDPRDTQLWRDVAARLRDDEAAVADANQRAEQAEAALVRLRSAVWTIADPGPGCPYASREARALLRAALADVGVSAIARALVADQPDPDPGWPDETRRQPDQEPT